MNPHSLKVALVALRQVTEYEPQSDLGARQKALNEKQLRAFVSSAGKKAAS
jgi:hypothetical protein